MWCRRAMIPGEIFTSFTEFQGIVSVNVYLSVQMFLVSFRVPGTFASFSGFLVKFCFCTDTPGSIEWLRFCTTTAYQVIVSRFAIVTERPCDLLLSSHQKFSCTRYVFAIASSAWGPCNFGPFTDLAISVFREMSMNTVLTQILTSLEYGL